MLWQTDCEDEIMQETFLLNTHIAYLYLYKQQLVIKSEGMTFTLHLDLNLSFQMERTDKGDIVGLLLYKGEFLYHLKKSQWPDALMWESTLRKYIPHANFHDYFKPIKKLGRGNYAGVYLALKKSGPDTGKQYAIKAFYKADIKSADGRQSLCNQIKVMRSFQSANTAQLYGLYESSNTYYLCMQYVPGTTLADYFRTNPNLPPQMRKKLLKGLLTGVKDMQSQRIIHRDIKPENIVVDSTFDRVKIVDFGLATLIDQPKYLFVRCGTPGYVAPEIIRLNSHDLPKARLRLESDLFSVGAVYYQAVYQKVLFDANNSSEATQKNKDCFIEFPHKTGMEEDELQLLVSLLKISPNDRIAVDDALTHPFLTPPQPCPKQRKYSYESAKTQSSLIYARL